MNNEYLRVNSKTDEQDIAVSEFKNEKKVEAKDSSPTLNLITLLNFSRSKSGISKLKTENLPNFKGLLSILLIHASVACVLTFISFVTSDVTVLLFTAAVVSVMFPLFLLLFFYNLNTSKATSIMEVILGVIIGISLFVFLNLIDVYLKQFIKYTWFKSILELVIRDTVLFLGANLFVKIAKKDNLFDALLLSISLYAGYLFAHSLDILINSLFIGADVIIQGQQPVSTGVIMLNKVGFTTTILDFINSFVYEVIFISLIIGCTAIINGGVIGLNVSPLKDASYREWSLYVLFIITVILHLGAIFPSATKTFSIILKCLSAVFLLILTFMIINYYLSKIHVDKSE